MPGAPFLAFFILEKTGALIYTSIRQRRGAAIKLIYSFAYESPIGELTISADEQNIKALSFGAELKVAKQETKLIKKAYFELCEYFAGTRKIFDFPFAPDGTAFQKAVWQALSAIPYGETRSYGEIAKEIGKPKAAPHCYYNTLPQSNR
jgi:methylated-DNA-[protein]-cysteine S-methyltransferase